MVAVKYGEHFSQVFSVSILVFRVKASDLDFDENLYIYQNLHISSFDLSLTKWILT